MSIKNMDVKTFIQFSAVIAGLLIGLFVVEKLYAAERNPVYVGDGRYTCTGDRSGCRAFEAQERARQEDRRYYKERLDQERRRERREEREDREYSR